MIVATQAAVAAAGRVTDGAFRDVELRGISAPVSIAMVRWS